MDRKRLKRCARQVMKKHYLLFAAVCLIAAFIGAEFSSSLSTITGYDSEKQFRIEIQTGEAHLAGADTQNLSMFLQRVAHGKEGVIFRKIQMASEEERDPAKPGDEILGRSRGVLAQVVNTLTSGSITVTLASGIQSIITSSSSMATVFTVFSIIAVMLFWLFLQNTYIVISRRIFLESRTYQEVPIQRFLFLFLIKKWLKTAWNMLVYKVLYILWWFTVIGGVIKHYSYFMVPYIIAENPDISAMKAITLSRRMMNGHKWECFKLDLTFIGWQLLGVLTIGITNLAFTNPYRIAVYSEYYAAFRKEAIDHNLPDVELLDDRYLYECAEDTVIADVYADVIEIMKEPVEEIEELKGIQGFFANVFGVVTYLSKKEKAYEKSQAEHIRIRTLRYAVEKKAYPYRLFTIPERMKRTRGETILFMRHYSVWSLVIMFFMFSFIGWLWEVGLHLITYGELVNRGVLHGPWLPIYGSGAILILIVLNKVRKYPVVEFFATILLCGIVEYVTSFELQRLYDIKWWDYKGYFLNLNGRICAEGLLVFGIGGMAIVYVVAPFLDNMIKRMQFKKIFSLCLILLMFFTMDVVYSHQVPNIGHGISNDSDVDVLEVSD